ncbi:MAG: DUF2097 domain-containing protein [Methanosphaera sp.]|nr:DUF2097 domain-containing protein [Methanosphaera sp.]
MTNNITLHEDELVEYILDNFKEKAILEVSYNRVFLPSTILAINKMPDKVILSLKLEGKLLHQHVDININDIKKELVELRYTYMGEETVITII